MAAVMVFGSVACAEPPIFKDNHTALGYACIDAALEAACKLAYTDRALRDADRRGWSGESKLRKRLWKKSGETLLAADGFVF